MRRTRIEAPVRDALMPVRRETERDFGKQLAAIGASLGGSAMKR